jgi:hypothetical protein
MSKLLHPCVAVQVSRQTAFRWFPSLVADEHWPHDFGDLYRHTYIILIIVHDIKVSINKILFA